MVGRVTVLDPLALQPPPCGGDGGWCQTIYSGTNNKWLASSSHWLIAKPITIILIIIGALIVRAVARRLIDRLTNATGGQIPTLPRPPRQRAPHALRPPL